MRTAFCLAALSLMAAPSPLVAQDLITFRFHGVVERIDIDEGPHPPGVAIGSSFDGTYSFNPAAHNSSSYNGQGLYRTSGPSVVQASIEDLHWHADKNFVSIFDNQPQGTDYYEAGASRITLDAPADLAERLDIWIFQLVLRGDGDILSDVSLLQTPPDVSQWDDARLHMIGESTIYSGLDPMPAVMITATLTELELAGDFDGDGDVDSADLAGWEANFGAGGSATHDEGDANGDGMVDGADFLAWQRQLTAPAAPAVSIPEPTSSALAAVLSAAVALYGSSRRRASRQ